MGRPCKICSLSSDELADVEKMLLGGFKIKEVIEKHPDISYRNVETHRPHMQIAVVPPEITSEELDKLGKPDLISIVYRQVNEYELLKRRRKLTPSEELARQRYIEFMMKLELEKMTKPMAVPENYEDFRRRFDELMESKDNGQ